MAQLHQSGEQFIQQLVFEGSVTKPADVDVGLYNSSDALADGDDYSEITTEPSDGNYTQQQVSFDETGFTSSLVTGDWQSAIDSDVVFNVEDTTGSVDKYFVLVNYDAGGGADDHLFFTGDLSQSYDLSNLDSLTLEGAEDAVGLSID